MDYYIIQREEKDIGRELSNRLVEILTAVAGIHKIDAAMQIKRFQGILKVSGDKQTENISRAFKKAGLDNFIIKEQDLVILPQRKQLLLCNIKQISELPGIIAAGLVRRESQQTVRQWNPLQVKVAFTMPLICDSGIRENRKTKTQSTYYIDIITRDKHWGITKSVFPHKEIKELEQLDLLRTYLTKEMRKMFQGQKCIKTFSEQKYYNEYLTWLVQLVYAKYA